MKRIIIIKYKLLYKLFINYYINYLRKKYHILILMIFNMISKSSICSVVKILFEDRCKKCFFESIQAKLDQIIYNQFYCDRQLTVHYDQIKKTSSMQTKLNAN